MKTINYKLLNERLEHFLFDGFPVFEDDFVFEERLCNMLIDNELYVDINTPKDELYETKNDICLDKVINICLDFFKSVDEKYSMQLAELIKNEEIDFEQTNDIDEKSYVNTMTGEIRISLLKRVEDILSLGHEFMHHLNTRSELVTYVTSFYTECFSNYCEFLLIDYVAKEAPLYKSDILKMKRNIFISLYENNICTKLMIEMMKKKINGIDINYIELVDIVKRLYDSGVDLSLIDTCLTENLEVLLGDDEELVEDEYIHLMRNTISLPIACYMYEEYSKKKDIKQVFELGDVLYTLSLKDVLLYFELEPKPECSFDLTEQSYEKLENSYKKSLKKLW